jgi:hypothetical protein
MKDLTFIARIQDLQLQPERSRGVLHLSRFALGNPEPSTHGTTLKASESADKVR